jgi:hydroxymethylpyrimidine/phosphomethylpyrimidine kinase
MKLGLISGEDVIKCVIQHIVLEDEEFTMPVVLSTVQWILKFKLSQNEDTRHLMQDLYDALFKKLSYCKANSMEVLILSVMIPLMSSSKADQASHWIKDKFIPLEGGKKVLLRKPQRYQLLKIVFSSTLYYREAKYQLL